MNGVFVGSSSVAPEIERLFWAMTALAGLVAAGVFIAIWTFSIRYRHGSVTGRDLPRRRDLQVELTWTLIPLVLFLGIFIWSIRLYARIETVPQDAMPVFVVAKQWMWKVQHLGGQREINQLHVPVGRAVQLEMSSEDVIHSFFVPAFRVKQDVLPGRYTQLWFEATRPGRYALMCAEYCGTSHSQMRGEIIAMQPQDYQRWLQDNAAQHGLPAQGEALFRAHGCSGCHAPDSRIHAPDLDGVAGRPVNLADGRTVIADDDYLRDAILIPRRDVVAGYAPIMPSFAGQLDEAELFALLAYLHALDGQQAAR